MPSLSDEALIQRAEQLHKALEAHHLSRRGLELSEERFNLSKSQKTVSLSEGRVEGGTVRVVNTNNSTFYGYLARNKVKFLAPGEELGSRNTNAYGPTRRSRQTVHAEQLGANDLKERGATSARIATSNRGCDKLCVSLLREEFPTYRHVNPKIPGTQPPPIPEPVDASSAGRTISNESRMARPDLSVRGTSPASRGVADNLGEAATPRRAARTAIRDVGREAAASSRVFVSAERTALRSAIHAVVHFEALVSAVLLAGGIFEIVIVAIKVHQEVKRQRAIEDAIKTKLAGWLHVTMVFEAENIASLLLNRWRRPSELILYASPLLDIRTKNGTDYTVEFSKAGSLTERAVSRTLIEPEEEERAVDYWQLRFSIPYPILTPFDAYLAYLDVVGEYFTAGWRSAAERKKVNGATTRLLVEAATDLSTVAAWLKTDDAAGFDGARFDGDQAAVDRQRVIRQIKRLVDKRLFPRLRQLEKLGVLDPDLIVVSHVSSGVQGRIRDLLAGDDRLSRYMEILVADLSSIPAKALRYQRRNTLSERDRMVAQTLAHEDEYFAQLTADVREFLPKDRQPVPMVRQAMPTGDIILVPPQ